MTVDNEEELLRSVALQNANSIFLLRQRAEQELIRVREALEAKTEALARALATTEESLRERDRARAEADEARRAAQDANDAKGRFLSMVSHELRTPLGAIGGYASLLHDGIHGAMNDEQQKFIARILHNQKHILRLVNELLDLAKIEAGQFPMQISAVSVHAVIGSVRAMIEPQVQERGLRLEVRMDDATLRFLGDGERVEQIVLNLLSNAVKFTESGGSITISTDATEGEAMIRVTDTGVGIPEEKLEAVFQPFFQVEETTAQSPSGTGLGLAISRELARAMKGGLTVESTPGIGSTFSLCLPRAAGEDAEA